MTQTHVTLEQTDEIQSVLISPEHWAKAHQFWKIFPNIRALEKAFELQPGQLTTAACGLDCPTCPSRLNHPCTTKSGKPTTPHARRYQLTLACIFAFIDETIIHEQPDPEDII